MAVTGWQEKGGGKTPSDNSPSDNSPSDNSPSDTREKITPPLQKINSIHVNFMLS